MRWPSRPAFTRRAAASSRASRRTSRFSSLASTRPSRESVGCDARPSGTSGFFEGITPLSSSGPSSGEIPRRVETASRQPHRGVVA